MKTLFFFLLTAPFALGATKTFEQLTTAGSVNDTDIWPVVQSPSSSPADAKYTAAMFKAYCLQGWSLASGKSLSVNNTLTLAGTDGSTLNIGAGGTLGSAAFTPTSAYDAAGAAGTAQSNAEAAAANATNLTSGTVNINRLPTGTTSTTVALGNAPAAAQAAAISAAEASASAIYIPLAGGDGSNLTGYAESLSVNNAYTAASASYADEAGYAANAESAAGLSSNLPLDEVNGVDSSYYTPLAAAVNSSGAALVSRAGTDARTDDVIIAGMNMKTSWISCGFVGTSGSGTFSGANYDGMNLETGTTASSNVSVEPWYNFNRYSGVNFGEPFTVYFTVHGSGTQFTHNTLFFDFGTNGTISTSPASSNICEGWAFSGGNWTPYASNGTTETTGSAITGSGGFQTDSSNIYSLKMVHVPGTGLSLYIKNLTTGGSYSLVGTTANPGAGAATSYAFRIYLVNGGTAEDNAIGFVAMTFLNTAAY